MSDPVPDELDADIIAYFVGDLDDERFDALDRRLREDPAAARRLAELSTREVLLSSVLRMRAGHPDHPSSRLQLRVLPRRARWPWIAAAAAAAVIAIATGLSIVGGHPSAGERSQPIATVTAVTGDARVLRGDNAVPLAPTADLAAGDRLVVPDGARVAVTYPDGTRLDLGPATNLDIASPTGDRLDLARGEVAATVAHRSATSPFVLTTAQARAEVVGTRLSLTASPTATRLRVEEGSVRFTRTSDDQVVVVEAQHAATALDGDDAPLVAMRLASLADTLPLGDRLRFSTRFADDPTTWRDALGTPPGAPADMVAARTLRIVGAARSYLELSAPAARPLVIAGERSYLSFRYLTERFATSDLIAIELRAEDGASYACRIRPRFETPTTATLHLDGTFTTADHHPLPAGARIAACTWRAVAPDGTLARKETVLWVEDAIGFESSATVSPTPAVPADEPAPTYRYLWNFDDGEPHGITPIAGEWRHLPDHGVDGSGCMELTTPEFAAELDVPPPAFPVRVTVDQCPLPPGTDRGYSVFVQWSTFRSLTQLRDVGRTLLIQAPSGDATEYVDNAEYLFADHMEERLRGERSALSFGEPEPSARLQLFIIGLSRIDNLRIESIRAEQAPPVDDVGRALAALPERRPGTTVTLALPGQDPAHPARAEFRLVSPGQSPWIQGDPTKP